MTEAMALICSIVEPGGVDEAVLADVTERASKLIRENGDPPVEWNAKQSIFCPMEQVYGKKADTLRKSATRAAHKVWDVLEEDQEQMRRVIGRRPVIRPYPQEIVLYLAYYLKFRRPYFEFTLEQLNR